jgi:DNA repair exonuclease SbcCD nuclease subunit
MKLLVFGDLHVGKRYSNTYFLDLDMKAVDLVCEEAKRSKADKIIFLGDFFHDRSDSTPKAMVYAREILDKLNALGIPVIMIIGNHDLYYNNKRDYNYYRIFEGLFNNILFIETIQEDGELLYVGWMQTPEEQAQYNKLAKNHKWIFGHFEFKGAEMSEFYKTKEGLENTNENSYIFSGHIHQRSRQGRLHYIGSPYPYTWNGKNRKDYGYVLIDTDTEEIKFTDLRLYHFNDYKLQKLLMMIHMDNEAVKKEMLNSETNIKVDVPLDERQLVDLKIYLNNTFKPKDLIVEKEDFSTSSENVSYDKLQLNSPTEFITDYILGMKIEEIQKNRILEKVKKILVT